MTDELDGTNHCVHASDKVCPYFDDAYWNADERAWMRDQINALRPLAEVALSDYDADPVGYVEDLFEAAQAYKESQKDPF